jgi:hypothetical protein
MPVPVLAIDKMPLYLKIHLGFAVKSSTDSEKTMSGCYTCHSFSNEENP